MKLEILNKSNISEIDVSKLRKKIEYELDMTQNNGNLKVTFTKKNNRVIMTVACAIYGYNRNFIKREYSYNMKNLNIANICMNVEFVFDKCKKQVNEKQLKRQSKSNKRYKVWDKKRKIELKENSLL